MTTDVERAVWAFEEAVQGVLSFVKGTSYSLRLAAKRIGDLAVSPASSAEMRGGAVAELERLREALEHGEDHLSDAALLVLGDHFRAFLGCAMGFPELPPLPRTIRALEAAAGIPGALAKASSWLPLGLELYRVALRGGILDRSALESLGTRGLELRYPSGKIKLFQEGDHVTLTEHHLGDVAEAYIEAARVVRLRFQTA